MNPKQVKISTRFAARPVRLVVAMQMIFVLATEDVRASDHVDTDSAAGQDEIVAVINDGYITKTRLLEQVRLVEEQLDNSQEAQSVSQPSLQQAILDRVILEEVKLQRARLLKLEAVDSDVESAMERIAQRNGLSMDKFGEALSEEGIDFASYKESIRDALTIESLERYDYITSSIAEPAEIENRVAWLRTIYAYYDLSVIGVEISDDATEEEFDAKQAFAYEIYNRLKAGEDFGELAEMHSDYDGSGIDGRMGEIRGDSLPRFAFDAVVNMQTGDFSNPILATGQYLILMLNGVRLSLGNETEESRVRHILLVHDNSSDDNATRQRLMNIKAEVEDGGDFAAIARRVSADQWTRDAGGDLGWQNDNALIPEIAEAVSLLAAGEIAGPIDTVRGWHLLQLVERRTTDNAEVLLRRQAWADAISQRTEVELELWEAQLLEEAHIEYRAALPVEISEP